MLTLRDRRTADLTPAEKQDLRALIESALEVLIPAEEVMERYCASLPRVVLAYENGTPAGFQFHQQFVAGDILVRHFSLAGKAAQYTRPGLQRAIGARLLRETAGQAGLFRRFAVAGIANNPKAYSNMLRTGGDVFPDVLRPERPFAHHALYRQIAERLAVVGLDINTGVVANRAASVGIRIRPESFHQENPGPTYHSFLRYVGGDVNQGLLTVVVTSVPQILIQQMTRH